MAHQNGLGLKEFSVEIVRPRGPFSAKTTLLKPSHFPSPFDQAGPDRYRSVTRVNGEIIGVDAWIEGPAAVGLRLYRPEGSRHSDARHVKDEIRRRLGLDMDVEGYEALWRRDKILRKLPDEMMGARPSSAFALYEFLMICVFLQNTTVNRTVAMATALADEAGQTVVFPDGATLRSFWTPSRLVEVGEERMRALKLGYRAKMLNRLSQQFQNEPQTETALLELVRKEELLRQHLLSLYGIGPASVGYIMFEWFKCVNCFNHISPWELKILSMLLFEKESVDAKEMIAFCTKRWAPHTMLAVHAIFEAVFWRRLNGNGPEWLDALIRL